MTSDRELMHMAMYALMTCREDWIFDGEDERPVDTYDKKLVSAAFKALRARLEQPEPEPVVWMYQDKSTHEVKFQKHMRDFVDHGATYEVPLYTAPPQREWQGLTDEEIAGLWVDTEQRLLMKDFARAIEAKLKEKNNGR